MYTLFTHKGLNDKVPFELTSTIKKYIIKAKPEIIIVSPGYLSTNDKTTKNFLKRLLKKWYKQKHFKAIGITAGMNGVNSSNSPINLGYYWSSLSPHNVTIIEFKKNGGFKINKDHKKMVFFGEVLDKESMPKDVDIKNLDDFIKNIKITAAATGSSNFSKTTYLGNNSNIADKGEADIFMYTKKSGSNNKFHAYLLKKLKTENRIGTPNEIRGDISQEERNEEQNPPILSKSIQIGKYSSSITKRLNKPLSTDEQYLTAMLYKTLKDQLK